jgi:hypothetical protein
MSTVDLVLFVHHETDAAYLVSDDGDRDKAVWLPKSQIQVDREYRRPEGRLIDIEMPEWLALKKGLI